MPISPEVKLAVTLRYLATGNIINNKHGGGGGPAAMDVAEVVVRSFHSPDSARRQCLPESRFFIDPTGVEVPLSPRIGESVPAMEVRCKAVYRMP